MEEKWINNRWVSSFVPIVMLFVFMAIFAISQQSLTPCHKCGLKSEQSQEPCKKDIEKFDFCSRVIIHDHILSSPQETLDKENNLIKTKEQCKAEKSKEDAGKTSSTENKEALDKDIASEDKECDTENRGIMAKRLAKQWVFWHWYGLNVFVCLVGLAILAMLVFKSMKRHPKIAIFCLTISLFLGLALSNTDSPVISSVVFKTIRAGKDQGGLYFIQYLINFVNFLSDTGIFFTAFALFAVLFRRPDKISKLEDSAEVYNEFDLFMKLQTESSAVSELENPSKKSTDLSETLDSLTSRLEDLRLILYISSAFLIFGMLRMSATLEWSLAFLPKETAEITHSFLLTFTYVIGFAYTSLLAAIYLPAYYILTKRASSLVANLNMDQSELPESFKLKFFNLSFLDSLPRIAAIFAPILTGMLSHFFEGIFSK